MTSELKKASCVGSVGSFFELYGRIMVFKWREAYTLLFLDLLKNYECLWNSKNSDYKIKTARENAIQNLISDLNLPGVTEHDVKAKMKSIRTRYAFELAKVKKSEKSGAGIDDIYVPKLFWYKQADSFLRSVCVPRSSTSNMDIQSNTDDPEKKQLEDAFPVEVILDNDDTHSTDIATKEWNSSNDGTEPTSSSKKNERKRGPIHISSVEQAINKLKKISEENNAKETEFDFFCKSLAVQLNKMPLHRALVCQEKLQQIMSAERLYQLRCTDSEAHCSSSEHLDYIVRSYSSSPYSNATYPTEAPSSENKILQCKK